jgi:hypothetical protein
MLKICDQADRRFGPQPRLLFRSAAFVRTRHDFSICPMTWNGSVGERRADNRSYLRASRSIRDGSCRQTFFLPSKASRAVQAKFARYRAYFLFLFSRFSACPFAAQNHCAKHRALSARDLMRREQRPASSWHIGVRLTGSVIHIRYRRAASVDVQQFRTEELGGGRIPELYTPCHCRQDARPMRSYRNFYDLGTVAPR